MKTLLKSQIDTAYVKLVASVITLVVLVLVVVNIVVSAQVSYWGYQLGQLDSKSSYLAEANRLLKQDITRQTSLTKYMDNARSLGFQSGIAYLRLPQSQPVALGGLSEP